MRITVRRVVGAASALVVVTASGALASTVASAATTPAAKATVLKLGSTRLVTSASGASSARLAATLLVSGQPLAGQKVSLRERKTGVAAWTAVPGTLMTTAKGVAAATVTQANSSEQYEFVFTATTGYTASHSAIVTLTAAKVTTPAATALRITALHTALTAAQKYQDPLTGVLTAAKAPLAGKKVVLRERATGTTTWTTLAGALVTNAKGVVTRTVTQTATSEEYQFAFAGDAKNHAASSSILTVTRP